MNITRTNDLVRMIAEKVNLTQAEIKGVFDVYAKLINEMEDKGDKILLPSLGNFQIVQRAEKKGYNPQTGEKIIIPARLAYKFQFGKIKNKFKE